MTDSTNQLFEKTVLSKLEQIEKLCEDVKKTLSVVDGKSSQLINYGESMANSIPLMAEANNKALEKIVEKFTGALDTSQEKLVTAYKESGAKLSPKMFMYMGGFALTILSGVGYYQSNKSVEATEQMATIVAAAIEKQGSINREAAEARVPRQAEQTAKELVDALKPNNIKGK